MFASMKEPKRIAAIMRALAAHYMKGETQVGATLKASELPEIYFAKGPLRSFTAERLEREMDLMSQSASKLPLTMTLPEVISETLKIK